MSSFKTNIRIALAFSACGILALGCITAPEPDPDFATIWGFVRLVPKQRESATGGGYGDRRLVDAKRFDYSHLRYAVVFLPGVESRDASPVELTIEDTSAGPRITPLFSSTDTTAGIQIRNTTDSPQLVSAPLVRWLKRIEPGSTEQIAAPASGELILHLLSAPPDNPVSAQVWVVEGMHVEVEPNGRYAIRGLAAGEHDLRAWHPRLPPSPPHSVDVAIGGVARVDLDITVDLEKPVTEERE